MQQFLAELKRRRVFRVAAAYAAIGFVIAQAADIFLPGLGLPEWSLRMVLALMILGFPVVLVLAWVFDVTPEGVVRTEPLAQEGGSGAGASPAFPSAGRLAVAGAVLLLGLAGGAFIVLREQRPALVPDRVVVAPFENRTGDPALDPVRSMAADWITQGISQTALVDVVPANTALRSAQYVQKAADAVRDPLRALAEETGAGMVVSGAFYRQGDSIQFQAQITDARRGTLLRALAPVSGPAGAPTEAIELLRQRVLGGLALHLDPRLNAHAQVGSVPPSYEAFRAYAEGRERFIARDWAGAIEHFRRAFALDSSYTVPLLFTAIAHSNLGENAQADSIARLVDRSRESLAPYDRAVLDIAKAWLRGDRIGAYEAAKRGGELAPTSLTAFQPGFEALKLNRPREAVKILSALEPTRGELRGWSFYWEVLTAAHHLLGDHRRELRAARQGRAAYPDDPQHLVYEARALAALGRIAEIERIIETRLVMGEQLRPSAGALMLSVARELDAHGYAQEAQRLLDRAYGWYDSHLSAEQRSGGSRGEWAMTLYSLRRWDEAHPLLAELAREDPENIDYQGMLGVLAARRGDQAEAERIAGWLAARDPLYLNGWHTYLRARIAAQLGQKDRAVTRLKQALAQGRPFATGFHTDPDLTRLRNYPPFLELLKPKG